MSVLNRPTARLRLALIGCGLVLFAFQVLGQADLGTATPSPALQTPTAKPSPAEVNTTVLQFESFLHEQAKDHYEFLKDTLEQLKWFLGGLVVIGGIVFTWLNYKTRKEVETEIKERFRAEFTATFNAAAATRLELFDRFLEENKMRIEENTKKTEEVSEEQLRLTDRIAGLASDLTFAFHVLEEKPTDKQWDSRRRTAMKRLAAQQRAFPISRGTAILLGRLHKHFGEYGSAVNVLTQVMQERDKRKMVQNSEYADLLYNRACYRNCAAEKAAEKGDSVSSVSLRSEAWLDLNRAVGIDPDNKAEAFEDEDFKSLWNERDRKKSALGKIDGAPSQRLARTGFWGLVKTLFKKRA